MTWFHVCGRHEAFPPSNIQGRRTSPTMRYQFARRMVQEMAS